MRADMVVEPFDRRPQGHPRRRPRRRHRRGPGPSPTPPTTSSATATSTSCKDEADIEKIRTPEIRLDEEATARAEAEAHDVFDGILAVRMQGYPPAFAIWDRIVEWRGVENALFDLAARPDFITG